MHKVLLLYFNIKSEMQYQIYVTFFWVWVQNIGCTYIPWSDMLKYNFEHCISRHRNKHDVSNIKRASGPSVSCPLACCPLLSVCSPSYLCNSIILCCHLENCNLNRPGHNSTSCHFWALHDMCERWVGNCSYIMSHFLEAKFIIIPRRGVVGEP